MKKLFAILAVCLMCVACASPADKAVDYLENIAAAANVEEAAEITAEMQEWYNALSAEEKAEADAAIAAWYTQEAEDALDEYNDEYDF